MPKAMGSQDELPYDNCHGCYSSWVLAFKKLAMQTREVLDRFFLWGHHGIDFLSTFLWSCNYCQSVNIVMGLREQFLHSMAKMLVSDKQNCSFFILLGQKQ